MRVIFPNATQGSPLSLILATFLATLQKFVHLTCTPARTAQNTRVLRTGWRFLSQAALHLTFSECWQRERWSQATPGSFGHVVHPRNSLPAGSC